MAVDPAHRRPEGASDATVAAVGKASEAFEYVERARGALYEFHQLMGRADLLFGDAADDIQSAGHPEVADALRSQVVGRNVIEGHWTFQLVEGFDETYYEPVRAANAEVREALMEGRPHVFEAEMKADRRADPRNVG